MMDPIALYLPVFALTPMAIEVDVPEPPAMTMPEVEEEDGEQQDLESAFAVEDLAPTDDEDGMRIAQAREEALAEAAIATEAALAAQAAELESRHADALAEERRRWVEQESAALAEQLRAGLSEIERLLAEGVVEILQPFMERAVRAKAAEEMREAVTRLLADGDTTAIRVGGPADLIEPLRAAFADQAAIEFTETSAPEVTIEAGDTMIRTQLESWAGTLGRHLGEAN